MEKKLVVAALYVRNSDSSKMDSEVQKAQLEALIKHAREQGYEIREELIFKEAISAIKYPYWERKELLHMWDEAERGSFDVVLVTEMFRLARFASEQFAIIEHLKRYGVKVESVTEKFEDTAEGRLLMSIQGFLGEVEANKIAIRTSRGKHHRAKQALRGQGNACYGYKWGDGDVYTNSHYVLNLDEFSDKQGKTWDEVSVVGWMKNACLSGMSLRQIGFALTQQGIPTREGHDVWGVTTIRRILTDIRYTGRAVTTIDEEEFVLPDGTIPKIIEEEEFEKLQCQLAWNAELSPRNNKHAKDYVMRGLTFCGICGRKMHVKNYDTQANVYKCFRSDGLPDRLHTHSVSIACCSLDATAWEFAVPYLRDPRLLHEHIASLQGQVPDNTHSEGVEDALAKINKSIANLYKMAEVADDVEPLQEQLVSLQLQRRKLEKLHQSVASTEEKREQLRNALTQFEAWATEQVEFIDDPAYEVSLRDKIGVMLVLGVKATVIPAEGNPKRVKLELMPPDIERLLRSSIREWR